MITCKEDLMNTYIENDFGELRKTYIDKAIELGYNHQGNRERGLDWYDLPYIAINDSWDDAYVGQTADVTRGIRFSGSKILTLSDLKPTPTKFVKVEESIFDLRDEFERGELFTKKAWGEYVLIKEDTHLASLYEMQSHENSKIGIYRQVEIDWRDEVNSYFLKTKVLGIDCTIEESIETDFYNDEFIALCHLVASLTEKPEGV